MQVLSPVGRFRVSANSVRVHDGALVIDASLGAWKSEVTLERADLPLVASIVGVAACALAVAFGSGRRCAARGNRSL